MDQGPELCGEPCNYMHYDYTLSNSAFPGRNYWQNTLSETSGYSTWADAKYVRRRTGRRGRWGKEEREKGDRPISYTCRLLIVYRAIFRNNLVKISIYYDTLEAHMNDQTASYEIQNFIGESWLANGFKSTFMSQFEK